MTASGFRIDEETVRRYVASLMAKHFVILSGLSGSGKTKIAQLFAAWLDSTEREISEPFKPGTEIHADRTKYVIKTATQSLVEIQNAEEGANKAVPLPRKLIEEWATLVDREGFTKDTSAEEIREAAKPESQYANLIHGFASQLKAAAFHLNEVNLGRLDNVRRYVIVPVESNWTSTEDLFGYPDALNPNSYIRRPALDMIIRAIANYELSDPLQPYFLILDEMNLSHVERYFAAVLSAIESEEPIKLHDDETPRDGVPSEITLPPNLFVVGTINVDETTYMFSPKVLDRANVIEFRVPSDQIEIYLDDPRGIDLEALSGKGNEYAELFVRNALHPHEIKEETRKYLAEEAGLFFEVLANQEAEFGYRTAKEMARFLQFHEKLTNGGWDFRAAWDAQVLQKLLPKLHGSQRKLEPLLRTVAVLCHDWRMWRDVTDQEEIKRLRKQLATTAKEASDLRRREFDPLTAKIQASNIFEFISDSNIRKLIEQKTDGNMDREISRFALDTAYLKLSFEKVVRMLRRLQRDGFTSFAEA